jgi:hypothetical protein
MKISLRIDHQNARHIRFTVFINGANCGQLTTAVQEYKMFAVLLMGMGVEYGIEVDATAPNVELPLTEAA